MSFIETHPGAQAKILAIQTLVGTTARWRQRVSQKHGQDPRNAKAAQLLVALASEPIDTLPTDLIADIAAARGVSDAARAVAAQVGFHLFPTCLADFLEGLLDRLSEDQAEVDRVFPKRAARWGWR
jgi:hypothetical protein